MKFDIRTAWAWLLTGGVAVGATTDGITQPAAPCAKTPSSVSDSDLTPCRPEGAVESRQGAAVAAKRECGPGEPCPMLPHEPTSRPAAEDCGTVDCEKGVSFAKIDTPGSDAEPPQVTSIEGVIRAAATLAGIEQAKSEGPCKPGSVSCFDEASKAATTDKGRQND